MAILQIQTGPSGARSRSVTLGDLDSEVEGLRFGFGARIVPSADFPLFSLQLAYLHYNNLQDPLFRVFLKNLFGLCHSEDVCDEDVPTDYAIATFLELVWGARALVGSSGWRNPSVDVAGGGGIRIKWRVGNRALTAVTPPSSEYHRYLYYQEGNVQDAVPDYESATLAERLIWLNAPHAAAL
jgi:hypothetical protein